ncbi:YphG, TPR-domain containing [Acidisarcina polymorpha]|uniref:YphG, TPR-domain containing n=2 Tax=Acidisarcina polymorpha TaxID=2211140 RepID=A0A2Z5G1R8_9BACT|nr:YphG, TPR-domain containing [Acidisarcina polymorpha]
MPVIDRVSTVPCEHAWQAVHLENEYLRLMILPEIGGRIHVGYDKVNGYDFFYRQNVIKPALVGLAGPWISGGVEFNWPQHHRPATFLPVEVAIERENDGSVTVWCSDHDPMSRMKGMHGVCLRPGRAYLELKVRLYNRTWDTQTFLWWANVATRVHEQYQSFFPGDVRFVADHAKRAVTEFPQSLGTYYGIPYGERALHGVPLEETPSNFAPDGSYPANDLSWYSNIPVPTSYMIANSQQDFFGGYDHAKRAGMVHVADHHIAPGKKQWTWGNHEFGYAWDRSLTDADGPYIELMAGVYTDNQPDFSFLAPGETKSFSQFWYPIREIGVPDVANLHAALQLEREEGEARIHLLVTYAIDDAIVHVAVANGQSEVWRGRLRPEEPLHTAFPLARGEDDLVVELEAAGEILLRYAPAEIAPAPAPNEATEPPPPEDIGSNDELYLTGLHLEQYRHATRSPEPYWREAVRRDPGDSRANHALGCMHLRRGEFAAAETYLRKAIARLTMRNPNPYDSEAYYNLGMALLFQDRHDQAYDAFYKATWSASWRGPAFHRLAEMDVRNRRLAAAMEHLDRSLRADADNLNALNLRVVVLRQLERSAEAESPLAAVRALDPLDTWSRFLETGIPPSNKGQTLDLAFDLIRAGLIEDARRILAADEGAIALYAIATTQAMGDEPTRSQELMQCAAAASPAYVFPSRLEEMRILEAAIAVNPSDARAPYYLGNFFYDRRRHHEAIAQWENAVKLDPGFSTAWRNLGISYYNVQSDPQRAREAFRRAREASPNDARILYEQDQLRKRMGDDPAERLTDLEDCLEMIALRDDLTVELASLYNQVGRPDAALSLLLARKFQPWEGGEGLVLGEYVRAQLLLGRIALRANNTRTAMDHFKAADLPPRSLSEARHLLANHSNIEFWLGEAWSAAGNPLRARQHWEAAAHQRGDFQQMQVRSVSEMTYWSAMSLLRLGRSEEANSLFKNILSFADALEKQRPKIDYFATSLPAMLLFEEDLQKRQHITATFLRAQALLGMGRRVDAQRALEEISNLDRSHAGVCDLLADQAAW